MKLLNIIKTITVVTFLLTTCTFFSNTIENNRNNNDYNSVVINTIAEIGNHPFEATKVVAGPTIDNQPQSTIKCAGTSATFTVVASGTGTLTYSWKKNGTTLSDGGTISGATTATLNIASITNFDADSYTCDITDTNGTTTSDSVTLTVNALPILTKNGPAAICLGQSATLSITATNTTYLWGTGNTSSSITVNPTSITSYTVIGTGANGCTKLETFALQVNPLPTISISGTTTICNGTNTTLTATGATNYNWGGGVTTQSVVVSPNSNTTYTVTGTNSNLCASSTSKLVTVNDIPNASVSAITPICSGNIATFIISGTPNATVTYNLGTGSNSNVVLDSSGNAIISITAATSNQILNLVSVSLLGCQNTSFSPASATVVVNPINTVAASSLQSLCINTALSNITLATSGASGIGTPISLPTGVSASWSTNTITISGTPSVAGTFNYSIPLTGGCGTINATGSITVNSTVTPNFTQVVAICSGAALTALPTTSNNGITGTWSPAVNNAATTIYTFTPNSGQCATTASMTITVNPTVTPTFTPVATICSGATLSALSTTSNNGITGTWSPALNNAATTTYTFTPTSGQCATTATMTITVNPTVTTTFTPVAAICSGAALTALPTTSNNSITGTWSPAVNNAATTTYTFTPTAGQCATTATMTITVNPTVTPTFTSVAAICSGATLTALPTTSNNTITGSWSPAVNNAATTTYTFTPNTGQCATTATMTITVNPIVTPTFTPVAAICSGAILTALPTTSNNTITGTWSPALNNAATTAYTFTPNAGQCATTASITITVNALPTLTKTGPTAICLGQSATLSISGAFSYEWITTGSTQTSINISPNSNTTYTVIGTDVNGCKKTETFALQVNPLPTISISGTTTICNGTNTTLTAAGASSYNWGGGLTTQSVVVNPNSNTTYTVTGTDSFGCSKSAYQLVTVNAIPNASVSATTPICSGNIAAFIITGTPNATVTYNLGTGSNINVLLDSSGSATISIPGATSNQTITLVSVSLLGCQNTSITSTSATVVVNPIPASPGTSVINYCFNQAASPLTATGSNLKWYTLSSGGSDIPTPTPNTVTVGTTIPYYVSQTLSGCESLRAPITIIVNALPSVNAGTDQTICSGTSTTLTATGALTYNWGSGSQTTGSFVVGPTSNTTYTVTGTDANNCINTDQVTITVNPIPAIPNVTTSTLTYCQNQTSSALSASGNLLKWYTVSTGGTGSNIAPTPSTASVGASNYYVSQTVDGCESARVPISVTINALPTISISGNSPICANSNVSLTASGGSGSYTWGNSLGSSNPITVNPTNTTIYLSLIHI